MLRFCDVNVNVQDMSSNTKPATLSDVAKIAGVSAQTVSRVVNEKPGVSKDTRERVKGLIGTMGYNPNRAAQMLHSKRSHLLEVVMVDLGYPGEIGNVLAQMSVTAQARGYGVLFSTIDGAKLEETLRAARSHQVDGFVLIAHGLDISDAEMLDVGQGLPFVRMGDQLGQSLPSVSYDFRLGTRLALEHLYDLGHTRIAEISGPLDQINARVRHEEWRKFMREHGLDPTPSVSADYGPTAGKDGLRRLLETGEDFTAIFAGNDDQAVGIMHGLREHGFSVPDDISIVGFDDAQNAAFLSPPLTTVGVDFRKQGQLATRYLIDLIEDSEHTFAHQRILVPELIVRDSTGRPRA